MNYHECIRIMRAHAAKHWDPRSMDTRFALAFAIGYLARLAYATESEES